MSAAGDKLALSRLAIIEQMHHKEVGHAAPRKRTVHGTAVILHDSGQNRVQTVVAKARGWFAGLKRAFLTWWQHHPAKAAVELATPVLSRYAGNKPVQFIGAAAAVGAVAFLARPWRLISLTSVVLALLKSTQVRTLLLSGISAASDGKDSVRR